MSQLRKRSQLQPVIDKLPPSEKNNSNKINILLPHLSKLRTPNDHHNLLIIDNAGQSDLQILKNLEAQITPKWKVIISSNDSLDSFPNFSLGSLNRENAIELFKEFYKIDDDPGLTGELVDAFENHSLSVKLLAKIANYNGWSLDELKTRMLRHGFSFKYLKNNRYINSVIEKNLSETNENFQRIFELPELDSEEINLLVQFSVLTTLVSIPLDLVKVLMCKGKSEEVTNQLVNNLTELTRGGWLSSKYDEGESQYFWMESSIATEIRSHLKPDQKDLGKLVSSLS